MDIFELEKKTVKELSKIAKDLNIPNSNKLKREGLIIKIAQSLGEAEGLEIRGGVLEIMNEGIGFCAQTIALVRMMCMFRRRCCAATSCDRAILLSGTSDHRVNLSATTACSKWNPSTD